MAVNRYLKNGLCADCAEQERHFLKFYLFFYESLCMMQWIHDSNIIANTSMYPRLVMTDNNKLNYIKRGAVCTLKEEMECAVSAS